METSLTLGDLETQCRFEFEDQSDDLSSAKVCLILNELGQYFIFVARPTIPDTRISVFTTRQGKASAEDFTALIGDLLASTGIDAASITARVDEALRR